MRVLAAGSLRRVWPQLMAHFPEAVETQFGPAGLLRERIVSGEACDLFASANLAHPQALHVMGRAQYGAGAIRGVVRQQYTLSDRAQRCAARQ